MRLSLVLYLVEIHTGFAPLPPTCFDAICSCRLVLQLTQLCLLSIHGSPNVSAEPAGVVSSRHHSSWISSATLLIINSIFRTHMIWNLTRQQKWTRKQILSLLSFSRVPRWRPLLLVALGQSWLVALGQPWFVALGQSWLAIWVMCAVTHGIVQIKTNLLRRPFPLLPSIILTSNCAVCTYILHRNLIRTDGK